MQWQSSESIIIADEKGHLFKKRTWKRLGPRRWSTPQMAYWSTQIPFSFVYGLRSQLGGKLSDNKKMTLLSMIKEATEWIKDNGQCWWLGRVVVGQDPVNCKPDHKQVICWWIWITWGQGQAILWAWWAVEDILHHLTISLCLPPSHTTIASTSPPPPRRVANHKSSFMTLRTRTSHTMGCWIGEDILHHLSISLYLPLVLHMASSAPPPLRRVANHKSSFMTLGTRTSHTMGMMNCRRYPA